MKMLYPNNATAQLKEAIMYAERFAASKNMSYIPCSVLFIGLCQVDCLPKYILASNNIVDYTIELFMEYDENEYKEEVSLSSFIQLLNMTSSGKVVSTTYAFTDLISYGSIKNAGGRYGTAENGKFMEAKISKLFKEKGTNEEKLKQQVINNIKAVTNMVIKCSENEKIIVEQLDYAKLDLPISSFYKNKYSTKEIKDIINDTLLFFGEEKINEIEKINVNGYNPKTHNFRVINTIAENITDIASKGEIDDVIGREKELSRLITILSKRTKNNVIILGEPGVGKTALVEKLAKEIVSGNVPENLKNNIIYSLSVNSLMSGTRYRGDFEAKMKVLLEELESATDVILFIDEIHMIFKAGGSESTDITFGNVLKPYLARGKIKVIGATTYSEYKTTIEKDGALDRRFDTLIVNELSDEEVFKVITEIKGNYELFHNVIIPDNMVLESIRLAKKYIPEKHMPDKVIDLIDESLAISKLLNKNEVDKKIIASVISNQKNIDIQNILGEDHLLDNLSLRMNEKVFGQEEAIEKIVSDVRMSKMHILDTNSPASIILIGESGVGKTYIAKTLAATLFNSKDKFIRLDMTEFSNPASVTKIIGAPPGYVGFDKVDGITESVRKNPESVILFDEFDKADKDVQNLLLQILEEGTITDASSRTIDFSNAIIILTANIDTYKKKESTLGFENPSNAATQKDVISEMKKRGYAELLDRIDDIIFLNNLKEEDIKKIIDRELSEITANLKENGYNISYDFELVDHIYTKFFDLSKEIGARSVKSVVKKEAFKFISSKILSRDTSLNESFVITVEDGHITICEQVIA